MVTLFSKLSRIAIAGAFAAATMISVAEAEKITLNGASQFDENHAFTRLMRKFEQLTRLYYGGDKELEFVMHKNSELGLEKDYFGYMSRGILVDYAVVAPSHMSTFSKMATLLDPPMLYRGPGHWSKVMASRVLKPIEDDVLKQADVMLIGYGGGGVRNLIVNKPVTNMAALKSLSIRVMGAPIQTRMFKAFGMAPTVIAYDEIYSAMQTGVIDATENEAAGIQHMKFYEVGPNIAMTRHAITVRPLSFSAKTFRRLPKDLQTAIVQAGRDAGTFARLSKLIEDRSKLAVMQSEGKLKIVFFVDRRKLVEAARPVLSAYFKENDSEALFNAIQAIK